MTRLVRDFPGPIRWPRTNMFRQACRLVLWAHFYSILTLVCGGTRYDLLALTPIWVGLLSVLTLVLGARSELTGPLTLVAWVCALSVWLLQSLPGGFLGQHGLGFLLAGVGALCVLEAFRQERACLGSSPRGYFRGAQMALLLSLCGLALPLESGTSMVWAGGFWLLFHRDLMGGCLEALRMVERLGKPKTVREVSPPPTSPVRRFPPIRRPVKPWKPLKLEPGKRLADQILEDIRGHQEP